MNESAAFRSKFVPHDLVVRCTDGVTYVIRVDAATFTCPGCGRVGHA